MLEMMQLSRARSNVLSNISRDIAQVVFGSVFVGPLLGGTTKSHILLIGLFFAFVAWYFSVALVKE